MNVAGRSASPGWRVAWFFTLVLAASTMFFGATYFERPPLDGEAAEAYALSQPTLGRGFAVLCGLSALWGSVLVVALWRARREAAGEPSESGAR